jgi:alpha-ketoglutarate-dependent taurine dioxygenase
METAQQIATAMPSGDQAAAEIQENSIDAGDRSVEQVAADARAVIGERRVCLVRGFPSDPHSYLAFLCKFGTPLANYSSRSQLEKSDPHPQINRVKYKRKSEIVTQSVHYVAGGLRPHSARSWFGPRPRYFAMLMVEPGWTDTADGQRGETVVLNWHGMFAELAERDGDVFEHHFERLAGTPITFQANNVRETLCDLPLLYPLADARDAVDVGVRLKQDLGEKILALRDEIPDFERFRESLEYVLAASNEDRFQAVFPLRAGDLILMDNNRFAHGRKPIVGERTVDGETTTNTRELWSVTVA